MRFENFKIHLWLVIQYSNINLYETVLPMKISSLLIILLSINLAACVGSGGDTSDKPVINNTNDADVGDSGNGDSDTGSDTGADANICTNGLDITAGQTNYQTVYDNCIVWTENFGSVTVKYNSDTSELTGLGLRIHFDSSSMEFMESSDILSKGLIGPPILTSDDNEDLDQNSSTDKLLIAAWASLNGDWPGETYQDLVTLKFQKIDGGSVNYNLSYSATSVSVGFTFNP